MKLLPFQYADIQLTESIHIKGTPYFTRQAIGKWLGYSNPQKAIDNIINRNPHIDNSEWSVPLKLRGTDSKKYFTRVYDPIGLQLIVFESRQPRAINYKIAVAKLVADMLSREYDRQLLEQCIESAKAYNKLMKQKQLN